MESTDERIDITDDAGVMRYIEKKKERIAELQAENAKLAHARVMYRSLCPDVGSFAWALMQANYGKVVISPEGVSFKKTTSDYWNPESGRYDIERDHLCDLSASEDYWGGNLFDDGWEVISDETTT